MAELLFVRVRSCVRLVAPAGTSLSVTRRCDAIGDNVFGSKRQCPTRIVELNSYFFVAQDGVSIHLGRAGAAGGSCFVWTSRTSGTTISVGTTHVQTTHAEVWCSKTIDVAI